MSEIADLLLDESAASVFDLTTSYICEGCGCGFEGSADLAISLCRKCAKKAKKQGLSAVRKKDLSWQKSVNYKLVDSRADFSALMSRLDALAPDVPIGIDTETTGLFAKEDKIIGVSLSLAESEAVYIPVRHDAGVNLDPAYVMPQLSSRFDGHYWVLANAKFDMEMFYVETGKLLIPGSDIIVLNSLHDSTVKFGRNKAGLKAAAKRHLGVDMVEIEEFIGHGRQRLSLASFSPAAVLYYAAADADFTRRLHFSIIAKMEEENNPGLGLIFDVEMRLIRVLVEMELRGIAIDAGYLAKLDKIASMKLEDAKNEFYSLANLSPEEFNINSPDQLKDLFYNKLKIPVVHSAKTKAVTTGKEALLKLKKDHPIVNALERVRAYEKRLNDFIRNAVKKSRNDIIYYSLNQIGEAKTGRMSCSKISEEVGINMQQIPKSKGADDDINIRTAFKSRPGYIFLDCDFSQIELRVFASESGASSMLRAIDTGQDLHSSTAADVFKIPISQITEKQRSQAKGVNFTLTYGGGPWTIVQKNGVTEEEARKIYNAFFERNPEAKQWMDRIQRTAAKTLRVATHFGRWIRIPEFNSPDKKKRASAYRKAVNSPIQSGATDIFKIAVLRVDKCIKKLREKYGSDAIYLLIFVHDEILFEVRDDLDILEISAEIKKAMELEIEGYCKIKVDQEYGLNWGNLSPIEGMAFDSRPKSAQNGPKIELQGPYLANTAPSSVLPPKAASRPDKVVISIDTDVEQRVIKELCGLLNEFAGNLQVVMDYKSEHIESPYKVSEKVIPEIKRMFPRAIVQLQDADGNYVSLVTPVSGLIGA